MQKNLLNYASPKIRDVEKYAQITDTNLDKRIAICINGEIGLGVFGTPFQRADCKHEGEMRG